MTDIFTCTERISRSKIEIMVLKDVIFIMKIYCLFPSSLKSWKCSSKYVQNFVGNIEKRTVENMFGLALWLKYCKNSESAHYSSVS